MNKIYLILLLTVLVGCKKNHSKNDASDAAFLDINIFQNQIITIDSTLINSYNSEDLKSFYKKYNNETVWSSKDQRNSIIKALLDSEKEGLQPKDYNVYALQDIEKIYDNLSDSTLVKYDLLLTVNLQTYISNLSKGRIKPTDVYRDWDLKLNDVDINKILFTAIENNDLKSEIEKCKPQHIIYKKLKNALQLLNEFPEDSTKMVEVKDKIIFGKKNKAVISIKKKLIYWHDLSPKDTLTSIYDKDTQTAMKIFQKRHGLNPDGVIGKATVEALNYSKSQRIEQVIANLERWRWFAHDFGKHYLLINIPDYKLVAIKDNDTMQIQRIVVGKDSRKTPILESKITNINLNPNWTVPPTILREDIYPEAIKDKGVFRKKGLQIFDKNNNEVNPYTWTLATAGKYKYVQKPSRNNSLGSMKINFPNKYSVYLHDTNHRNYFDFTKRSLSSGCVRLEKPLIMAAYLLNDTTKWSLQKIRDTTDIAHYKKLIKEKENKIAIRNAKLLAKNPLLEFAPARLPSPELKTIVIRIKEEILIHQLYWTAWENEGKLQFREDIYCADHDVFSKLRY